MASRYSVKHVFRSWHLFLALLISIILATTFFAGINTKADITAQQVLNQQLSTVYKDMEINGASFNLSQLAAIQTQLSNNQKIKGFEFLSTANVNAAYNDTSSNQTEQVSASIVGITNNSKVYDGWTNKPTQGLGANETYVIQNGYYSYWTPNGLITSNTLEIGDVIQINLTRTENDSLIVMPLNLTVMGFAELNNEASSIISTYNEYFSSSQYGATSTISTVVFGQDTLLVDWNKTVEPFLNTSNVDPFQQSVVIYLNRDSLISAWAIDASVSNVQVLQNSLENNLASALGMQVTVENYVGATLQSFTYYSNSLQFNFIIASIPIFFIAWYVGTTVSDVSYESRRREIGLLSTKGFSKGQISRIFLRETLFVGLIGSLIGVAIGYLLTPLITRLPIADAFNLQKINLWTVIFTVAFGLLMAFVSTFFSARKASNISTISAIREDLPLAPKKSIWNKLAWIAFILGLYKIIIFISGVSVQQQLNNILYSGGNSFLTIICYAWLAVDSILTYFGPVLFLWGFVKLFIQGSVKFQEFTTRASRFLGDIGRVATKNVRRKSGRTAAVAFLVALILAYSIMVTGQLASQNDYDVRNTYFNVGADATAQVSNVSQSQTILNYILANISGVKSATVEYSVPNALYSQYSSMMLKAVDPQAYLETAYYEPEWFSGASVETAFADMAADNNTIILERQVAQSLDLSLGQSIALSFETANGIVTKSLKVVGFFGTGQTTYGYQQYWSYVPKGFYDEISSNLTDTTATILMKLNGQVAGQNVSQAIMNSNLMISSSDSFDNEWQNLQTDAETIGLLEIQQLGIVFAVLAASVGVALVSVVTMWERKREAALMSVKGLSYKQLVVMFLTENVAVIAFAMVLGVFTGIVAAYGNITSANAMVSGLVTRRLLFPPGSILMIAVFVVLIFASAIIPILIMARKYVRNLERMVRLR